MNTKQKIVSIFLACICVVSGFTPSIPTTTTTTTTTTTSQTVSSSSLASDPTTTTRLCVHAEVGGRRRQAAVTDSPLPLLSRVVKTCVSFFAVVSFGLVAPVLADGGGGGATSAANAKITTGGASTLQSGRTITITRGVNLDRSDFSGQNLKGVAFQQSIVRDSNFKGTNLVGASFFDATVDGSNFEGADMSLANVEMAQFARANLKNTVMREMYVSGATLFEGVVNIEGSDWTDTYLRRDQTKYLCNHPTAKGTNPSTGVDTRESLMCKD